MSIEGLHTILDKKEVVPTFSVRDLIDRPAQVEADYLYHVRTYVPVSRAAGKEDQISVEEFEKRLIKQVKDGKVPRGYVTAGYGYGKTTTALYLWQRAQDANIVIVPPFTLSALTDFLDAVYGWLRYKLGQSRPALTQQLEALYHGTINLSLEQLATGHNLSAEQAEGLMREGRLVLSVQPNQYVSFFEQATQIALEAGYEGLVVLPDEIQQYFRPNMKQGGDPIAPFFNIIQLLNTRAASSGMRFGFVMIITLEELAQIRDTHRRTDLLHRMKDLQIDLTSLYDDQFAPNLWRLMAKQFDFVAEAERIVTPDTLIALGEISARSDISDGPRTVINVFGRMVRRFVDADGRVQPYTPLDLATDFLDEQAISFAGDDKLRRVLRRALDSQIVREDPARYGPAVRLAAVYPTNGVARAVQNRYEQAQALDELMRKAIGDLVQAGSQGEGAVRLTGLAQVQERTAWLPATVREFRLGYSEYASITQSRAMDAFVALVKARIFASPRWKVVSERDRTMLVNRAVVFEGYFDSLKEQYPRRRVHVRLLWDDEPVKDSHIEGDVCIEYRLQLPLKASDDERRAYPGGVDQDIDNYTACVRINLLYHRTQDIPQNLQKELEDVWSPYDLSPLVLANIYQLIEEKRAEGSVPKRDDALIKNGFQPAVLDTLMKLLFNAETGRDLGAAGAAITEEAVGYMLTARYQDYKPLVAAAQWGASLTKYENALSLLESPGERTGDIEVEFAKKDDLAKRFTLSNTGLDSFVRSFPLLLTIVREPRNDKPGLARFTLHPMEREILQKLRASSDVEVINRKGGSLTIRRLNLGHVFRDAEAKGYLEEEVKALLSLLNKRGLAEERNGRLVEIPRDDLDLDELRGQFREFEQALRDLSGSFNAAQLQDWLRQLDEKMRPAMQELNKEKNPDPVKASRLAQTLRTRLNDVSRWAEDQRSSLTRQMSSLSIEVVQSRIREGLAHPLDPNSVEYVDQVNVLRAALEREMHELQATIEKLRTQLHTTRAALDQPNLSYATLAEHAHRVQDFQRDNKEVSERRRQLETRYDHFSRWRDLVTEGSAFQQKLGAVSAFDISDLKQDFARLSTDIRGEISSQRQKLDALTHHEPFAQRLSTLRATLEQRDKAQRQQFETFQRTLLDTLVRHNLTKRDEWRDVTFNPNDAEGSYLSVRQRTAQTIQQVLEGEHGILNQRRQMLDNIAQHTHHLLEADRRRLTSQAADLLHESEGLLQDLATLRDALNDPQTEFDILAANCAAWMAEQRTWSERFRELSKQLGDIRPTESEERLLDLLEQDSLADIVMLKSQYTDDDSFWQALRGLYTKNYLRVQIQRIQAT